MKHRWLGPWRASFDSCTNALPRHTVTHSSESWRVFAHFTCQLTVAESPFLNNMAVHSEAPGVGMSQ